MRELVDRYRRFLRCDCPIHTALRELATRLLGLIGTAFGLGLAIAAHDWLAAVCLWLALLLWAALIGAAVYRWIWFFIGIQIEEEAPAELEEVG